MHREAILSAIQAFFPKLLNWATWCLGHAGVLLCDDLDLRSSSGVQQGDPLGPLFFAAGLLKVLKGVTSVQISNRTGGILMLGTASATSPDWRPF